MSDTIPERGTGRLRLEPFDEHNRALVGEVHPWDWVNPTPAERYHLVVLGAGTGGLVSAAIAASLGARVALVERHLMGGDCLNTGCVPSKGVIRAARSWHEARESSRRFGGPEASGQGDFAAAMARMRRIRAEIAPVDGARRFSGLGVDVFLGEGRFTGPGEVEVDGARLRFRRAVVATGGRAATIPVPGLEEVGYRTNDDFFSLTELPPSLLVVGGGPIGCEMAQSMARMGSRVTLVHADPRLLPREDEEAGKLLEEVLVREGVQVVNGARLERAELRDGVRLLHLRQGGEESTVAGAEILLAAGRRPNVEGMGLGAAGVDFSPAGIRVDDRLRTSNRRVYAVGDVATPFQFTHVADHMARIAVQNALFFGRKKMSDLVIPWVTYTFPEVAHVGHTPESAAAVGMEVDTIRVELAEVDRAMLDGEGEGFLKVHLRKGSDRILGATLVAGQAGEMIGLLTLAITRKIGLGAVGGMIQPYPTQTDVVQRAVGAWRREKLTDRVRKLFGLFFRVVR